MQPPFTITNSMLNKILEISKVIGNLEYQQEQDLHLGKSNRIKAIHSSLAIEANSLNIQQITDIINGKRVLGNPWEIKEVKNAHRAYDEILKLSPYKQKDFLKVHKLLTTDIVNESGVYRSKDVGIFDNKRALVHMGARPQYIQSLMNDLFKWGANDDTPELIKSCVFHYEIEVIHPFEDGNGRIGRLWQTVILANWNPLFAWLPIETIIYKNQQAYYEALGKADSENNSNYFIEFMLDIILQALIAHKNSDKTSDKVSDKLSKTENEVYLIIKKYLQENKFINTQVASLLIQKSLPTTRRYLVKFTKENLLTAHGENKARKYSLKQ
jgi:Fic family protein